MGVVIISLCCLMAITLSISGELPETCSQGLRDYEQQLRSGEMKVHRFYRGIQLDRALHGKAYSKFTAHSYMTCAAECLRQDACKAFNFCPDTRLCELTSAVYSNQKNDLPPANGCLYFTESPRRECHPFWPSTELPYDFVLPPVDTTRPYRLDFAVKGNEEAALALSESPFDGNFFDVVIGGWANMWSAIRPASFNSFLADAQTPDILSAHEFRRLWLTYYNSTIQVGRGGEAVPFLTYYDAKGRVDVKYVGIGSYGSYNGPMSWIFYTYCDE